jgi:hypothetical protein
VAALEDAACEPLRLGALWGAVPPSAAITVDDVREQKAAAADVTHGDAQTRRMEGMLLKGKELSSCQTERREEGTSDWQHSQNVQLTFIPLQGL